MGCNCGGNFQIDDGLVEAGPPVVGDPSYFHNGTSGVTSDQAEGALVTTAPKWDPDTGRTEDA